MPRRADLPPPPVLMAPTAPNPMAVSLEPPTTPPDLEGSHPIDDYVRRALVASEAVKAARANVEAMGFRIPQAASLDDPMVQNTIWPFPSNGPQYALMGYMPYETMITQQFPWFGTLKLRALAAQQEVQAALAELAAAQLDAVAEVKRAYYDLALAQKTIEILEANRKLAAEVVELAQVRVQAGGNQQDSLRAQVALVELDRELVAARQAIAEARAELAQQLHVSPEADLRANDEPLAAKVPEEVESLYRLAAQYRPELQGQMANVAKDQTSVELARKKFYPNLDLGVAYGLMTRQNNPSPQADGRDNVGFVVGFNMPIYRKKLVAGVNEAKARVAADRLRYGADRDKTNREVKSLYARAKARAESLELLRAGILPRSQQALELAASGYRNTTNDFVTLNSARQEVLQLQLQIARLEAELGQALADLERVVGRSLESSPPHAAPPPPPVETPGPFQGKKPAEPAPGSIELGLIDEPNGEEP